MDGLLLSPGSSWAAWQLRSWLTSSRQPRVLELGEGAGAHLLKELMIFFSKGAQASQPVSLVGGSLFLFIFYIFIFLIILVPISLRKLMNSLRNN